ncbi:MAG: CRISPR-associated endonuclease Cas1 [Gemmatimonadota bacterium]|nr:CRISPR-associated endonuclease Cas1 [Gemmatimonadota bacterium]
MQLVINTFGAYLSRRGELFQVKVDGQSTEISARKVRSILISTGAAFSSDAVQLAVEKNIDILFLDKYGDPFGRVWHGRPGSTTAIRRMQLVAAQTDFGVQLALDWVGRKFDNQISLLTRMRDRRTRLSAQLTEAIGSLKTLKEQAHDLTGNIDARRQSLLGLEGRAGRTYWGAVSLLLPTHFRFEGRSRNPARDPFNCLLNYAYGILYGVVERACLLAGLDPYIGFIHTDHYNKPSLVFDLIEQYRIWADESVLGLFSSRKIKQDLFDKLKNGLTLNKAGKAVLIEAFTAFLDEATRYRGRNITRRDSIQFDLHRIANELLERDTDTKDSE